jgi:hypothetical protein
MALIDCPACGRQISIEAASCPQCGHPNREAEPAAEGPRCYACSALATTRCVSCNELSCARHLQSIYVTHGRGGANELRCQTCYSSARFWTVVSWIVAGIVLLAIIAFMAAH